MFFFLVQGFCSIEEKKEPCSEWRRGLLWSVVLSPFFSLKGSCLTNFRIFSGLISIQFPSIPIVAFSKLAEPIVGYPLTYANFMLPHPLDTAWQNHFLYDPSSCMLLHFFCALNIFFWEFSSTGINLIPLYKLNYKWFHGAFVLLIWLISVIYQIFLPSFVIFFKALFLTACVYLHFGTYIACL